MFRIGRRSIRESFLSMQCTAMSIKGLSAGKVPSILAHLRLIPPHRKPLAQETPPHLHVVAQFVWRSGAENSPFSDDISPVGYAQGLAHVVVGDQDADAAGL